MLLNATTGLREGASALRSAAQLRLTLLRWCAHKPLVTAKQNKGNEGQGPLHLGCLLQAR
eukprot:scaffold16163_cov106-Isochrysis_galbana.AAC.5